MSWKLTIDNITSEMYLSPKHCKLDISAYEKRYNNSDYPTLFDCVKFSAKEMYPDGLFLMGLCYERGYKVAKNLKKALEFYQKADTPQSHYAIYAILFPKSICLPYLAKAGIANLPRAVPALDELCPNYLKKNN